MKGQNSTFFIPLKMCVYECLHVHTYIHTTKKRLHRLEVFING